MAENAQPIIIKKVKKGGHGGAHGGSWKVAYADFVTAMMAFFLLLWLLSTSSEETLAGIESYFQSPSVINAAGGASTSMITLGKNIDTSKGEGDQKSESESFEYYSEEFEKQELAKLEDLKDELEYMIDNTPAISEFKNQLIIDITDEGLHIQIVDQDKRPMFDLGSSELKTYAKTILREISPILNEMPNRLSITGHTDASRYMRADGYSNWELSSDRANAARRELVKSGTPTQKIARVVGLASKFLLVKDNPLDSSNRRMSILVLKKRKEDDISRGQGLKPEQLIDNSLMPDKSKLEPLSQQKDVQSREQLKNAIRGGTVRRAGEIVRFRGE